MTTNPTRTRRERFARAVGPHLCISDVRTVYVPAQPGIGAHHDFLVTAACGQEKRTTLATQDRAKVRCPDCLIATSAASPEVAVTWALTGPQRTAIVDRFTRLNPHYQGAQCADILSELGDSDSDLDKTEAFFEAHPELAAVPGAGYAARALLWSGDRNDPIDTDAVKALLTAAGLWEA